MLQITNIITNLTKRRTPKTPWGEIKEEVLGKKYELSLVFAPNALMKKLNIQYHLSSQTGKKSRPATVLSFPLSKSEGEIFINLDQKKYSPLFLFIHAICHLKSFKHGARMEVEEKKLMKHYGAGYHHWA